MIQALNNKGYNAYAFSVPSPKELLIVFELAAPVVLTMMSKVSVFPIIFLYLFSCFNFIVHFFNTLTTAGETLGSTFVNHPQVMVNITTTLIAVG